MRYTEWRDSIKETWHCNDKIACLATRYYMGLEDLEALTRPVNWGQHTGSALLTKTEASIIKERR